MMYAQSGRRVSVYTLQALSCVARGQMSVEEAVMELDLTQADVVMFRHAGHGGLNVVYRRADGNIGWIDPALRAN